MRVLHLFQHYLADSENWLHNLVSNTPGAEITVASQDFLTCNYYSPEFRYLRFPLRRLAKGSLPSIFRRGLNRIIGLTLQLYPYYVRLLGGRFDIVHAHFSVVAWRYRILGRLVRAPFVVSYYGFDYEQVPHLHPEWRARYRRMFQELDLFLCEGTHGRDVLVRSGCPAHKVRVVKLGVNVGAIPYHRRVKRRGSLRLLQVAAFKEKKGYRYTLEAFALAAESHPDIHLTLVGPDPLRRRQRLLAEYVTSVVRERITVVEGIAFRELHSFMAKYHVFIHPSCYADDGDCEGGAPVVLLDAQATGMPVISTTHCDIPDEVHHDKTGLLVPEKDVAGLSDAIAVFCGMDQREFDEYSRNARAHVEFSYDILQSGSRLREVYAELRAAHLSRQTTGPDA